MENNRDETYWDDDGVRRYRGTNEIAYAIMVPGKHDPLPPAIMFTDGKEHSAEEVAEIFRDKRARGVL